MRVASVIALALLSAALAGCVGGDADELGTQTTGGSEPGNAAPRPSLVEPTFLPPVELGHACCGAEPNIAVGPGDAVYVANAGALWRSDDGGRTYEALGQGACMTPPDVHPCLLAYDRHWDLDGLGDTDIVVTTDGAVHWLALDGDGGSVPYQVSDDAGATFSDPVDLADSAAADREWIAARDDGRLYATWREFDGDGRLAFRRSVDNGTTWAQAVTVHHNDLEGPIALDPSSDRIYIPITSYNYDGAVQVARSADDGHTWDIVEAAPPDGADRSQRTGNPTFIFPVAAVDAAGNLYVVWSNDDGAPAGGMKELAMPSVWMTRSTDGGDTWSERVRLSDPSRPAIFPWIAAGDEGRIVVVWYENTLGLPNELFPDLWNVRLVQSVDADAADPEFVGGFANDEPFHVGAICTSGGGCRDAYVGGVSAGNDRSMLDLFEVAIKADGMPVVAWAADGPYARDRTTVYAGGVADGTPLIGA